MSLEDLHLVKIWLWMVKLRVMSGFSSTNMKTNLWWKVDLEDNYLIHKVFAFNCGDDNGVGQEKLKGF